MGYRSVTFALLLSGCSSAVPMDPDFIPTDDADFADGGTSQLPDSAAPELPGDSGPGIPDPVAAPDEGLSTPPEFEFCGASTGRVLRAHPGNYRDLVAEMNSGDTLRLEPGEYTDGLLLEEMNGSEAACYVIEGEDESSRPVLLGSSVRNTITIRNSSYIVLRNLELDGRSERGHGIMASGDSDYAHHIRVEGLHIHDHIDDQQIVGINAKCPAWTWVIRGNLIERAGTGIYMGDSDGSMPFVNGLIEYNEIRDTIGYSMQIKHQTSRPVLPGLPNGRDTIIRYNVFSKGNRSSGGDLARPNLLVGHFPMSGAGSDDTYLIYGNILFNNPTEALFQGEGNIAMYSNLLVNPSGDALHIQPHNGLPRQIDLFFNTIVATGNGIRAFGGDEDFNQRAWGNLIFAGNPLEVDDESDNTLGSYAEATAALMRPIAPNATDLDLHPQTSWTDHEAPVVERATFLESSLDFERRARTRPARGAYAPSE